MENVCKHMVGIYERHGQTSSKTWWTSSQHMVTMIPALGPQTGFLLGTSVGVLVGDLCWGSTLGPFWGSLLGILVGDLYWESVLGIFAGNLCRGSWAGILIGNIRCTSWLPLFRLLLQGQHP
jgi:hypothetical protein